MVLSNPRCMLMLQMLSPNIVGTVTACVRSDAVLSKTRPHTFIPWHRVA